MLSYKTYKMIQDFVHVGYAQQKRVLLHELDVHAASLPKRSPPVKVLELACGGGNLSSAFSPAAYYGIDLAGDRVAAAQRDHSAYSFGIGDVDDPQLGELVKNFDFVFCHGLLHHLDDQQCQRLLDAVGTKARKPTMFIAIEPVLPVLWRNPLAYLLAKMDDGDCIRTPQEWRRLLGNNIIRSERLAFFPRWPGHEEVYVMKFE
jgi:2-polyprenyl-3-methyl-5-hydroxy-6-metoxy-1,4-benzoquinol methylase